MSRKTRYGLGRLNDVELVQIAAALQSSIDNWSGVDCTQSIDERRLELTYDALIMEGARRFGAGEFGEMVAAERKRTAHPRPDYRF